MASATSATTTTAYQFQINPAWLPKNTSRYSESEDRGVFWSNDAKLTIGQMARSLGLLETPAEQQARARAAQDRLRGGPAR